MNAEDLADALRRDFENRDRELEPLRRLVARASTEEDRERLRRPLLLLIYSHFEGFCVFAIREYVKAVSAIGLHCREASAAVVAGAWADVFAAVATGDQKAKVFRPALPDDSDLHIHWRRAHFVESIRELFARPVMISEKVIRADSNLTAPILKRNLFIAGVPHAFVDDFAGAIKLLLGRRNAIAHGQDVDGVSLEDYQQYEQAFYDVCGRVIDELVEALEFEAFSLDPPTGIPVI